QDYFSTFMAQHGPYLRDLQNDVRKLAGHPLTIMFIHHVGKDKERAGTDNAIQGSSLFVGSFDSRWVVDAVPGGMVVTPKIKRVRHESKSLWSYSTYAGRLCWAVRPVDDHEVDSLKSPAGKADAVLSALRTEGPMTTTTLLRYLEAQG